MAVQQTDTWVARLRGPDDERDAALGELTDFLVRGLAKSMGARYRGVVQPEDIVQEAVVKILDKLDSFEGRSRFTTWAMTIANRVAISTMRRKHYQDVSLESLSAGEGLRVEIAEENTAPVGQAEDQRQVIATLKQLIDTRLSEKQQTAMRALLEGMPVDEIAERLGSNRNATYKLIHDGRSKLREGFEQSGVTAADITAIFA
ncbi:MAG: sigma-70 family RNA polymerase sigma factor [Planctomycetota bacterium]